jgi:spore coat polysaccharide biosynthesis predicted glycosyltransferase SpsG
LVISGGGLTSFELAALGVPFLGISQLPWEVERLKKMQALGICWFVPLDDKLKESLLKLIVALSDFKIRDKMSQVGPKLVDGKGVLRIARAIKSRWVMLE